MKARNHFSLAMAASSPVLSIIAGHGEDTRCQILLVCQFLLAMVENLKAMFPKGVCLLLTMVDNLETIFGLCLFLGQSVGCPLVLKFQFPLFSLKKKKS